MFTRRQAFSSATAFTVTTLNRCAFLLRALGTVVLAACAAPSWAGSIFVTGHDPIWHSYFGPNIAGATNLAQTGIEYARNGNALPFLFVESKTTPVPSGNDRTASFLTSALGYAAESYTVMDAADLMALPDFRSALDSFSAIVVASDHGGMLGEAELIFLNGQAGAIASYINAGGGLYAEAEGDHTEMIGATPRFGFLPFLVSSADFQSEEEGNTVTDFGAALGLVDSDVNRNYSHNYFAATGGMLPVDLYNGLTEFPLTLAYRGQINVLGAVPEPHTYLLMALGLLAVGFAYRRRRVAEQVRATELCSWRAGYLLSPPASAGQVVGAVEDQPSQELNALHVECC